MKEDQNLRTINVLDKGFVRLVKYMASDSDIVQSARVSYGSGTKTIMEDRSLIRYLIRHRHTSPLEMCEFKFHIKIPMDSWRQMIRHRTACLSGETKLWFDEPAAVSGGFRKKSSKTIKEIYDQWTNGATPIPHRKINKLQDVKNNIDEKKLYSVPELSKISGYKEESIRWAINKFDIIHQRVESKQNEPSIYLCGKDWVEYCQNIPFIHIPLKDRITSRYLRMINEDTQEIQHTHITDIWQTGIKPVYNVVLKNGNHLKMTKDHLCYTNKGWLTLEDALSLKINETNNVVSWSDNILFAANGVPAYQNKEWLEIQKSKPLSQKEIGNLVGVSGHTIKKWMLHFGIKYTSKEKGELTSKTQKGVKVPSRGRKTPLSPEALNNIKKARSGSNSNFWKGGITNEHSRSREYSAWIVGAKKRLLKKYNYKCAITGSNKNLEAHHIIPVWMDKSQERNEENLILLCRTAHRAIHANNLENVFIDWVTNNNDLSEFFIKNNVKLNFNKKRRRKKRESLKLAIEFLKVKDIKFVGNEMTYDLSVLGPFHNFIANGFVVHNSVNEYSTRYSIAINDKQQTTDNQWRLQAKNNKQGSAGFIEDIEEGAWLSGREQELHILAEDVYQERLNAGVAREQARKDLLLSTYTEAYWKIDLHNLFHFLNLRLHPHAQLEIRQYASAIYELIKPIVPIACEAFEDYVLYAKTFSKQELEVINILRCIANIDPSKWEVYGKEHGLSKREILEMKEKLGAP